MPGPGTVSVPQEFFRDVLPGISDLAELKAVLYVLRLAAARSVPAVPYPALVEAAPLKTIVGLETPEPAEDRMRRTLDRAVANGSLLRATVTGMDWLLPPTEDGRSLLDRLRAGDQQVLADLVVPEDAQISIERPNVFSLYERHIGPLTPLVAEQLRHAERSYPRDWIEEAILTAEQYGRHGWRYIEAILVRWEESGGPREVESH